MADNLTVTFGADASKLLGEMKLVEAQAKLLSKQIDAALKSGDTAKAGQLSQQFGTMKTQLGQLNQTAQQTGAIVPRVLNDITRASNRAAGSFEDLAKSGMGFRRIVAQFSSLGKGLESLGSILGGLAGGFVGAFAGVAIVQAITSLLGMLDEVEKKLLKIQEVARQTNVRPNAIQGVQELARGLAESADDAEKMLGGPAELLAKARTQKDFGVGGAAPGVNVMRGTDKLGSEFKNGITILRGGNKIVRDFSDALGILGIKAKDFGGSKMEVLRFGLEVQKAFLAMQKSMDPTQFNELSKALFKGLPAEAALALAPKLMAELNAKIAELEKAARGAEAALAQIRERAAAKEKLGLTTSMEELFAVIRRGWIDADIATIKFTTEFLQNTLPSWGAEIKKTFTEATTETIELLKGAWDEFSTWWSDTFIAGLTSGWTSFLSAIESAAKATLNAIQAGVSAVTGGNRFGDPSIPAMPMAAGGAVVGPGTATSDSVLARLSAGEYVMRARAVDHWGPHFMARLNALRNPFGFAGGGLVMPQRALPRFADGGMVTARTADGTVVNLHFPGGSFSLRADAEIVGGLTREARRAGMLSAGRMAGALA